MRQKLVKNYEPKQNSGVSRGCLKPDATLEVSLLKYLSSVSSNFYELLSIPIHSSTTPIGK